MQVAQLSPRQNTRAALRPADLLILLQDATTRQVLEHLHREGACTRAGIAQVCELDDQATLQTKIDALLAAGLIRATGKPDALQYRFRRLAWLSMKNNWALGLMRLQPEANGSRSLVTKAVAKGL